MIGWRFRTNWLGRQILQRFERWTADGHEYGQWVDAKAEDMHLYYQQLYARAEIA